MRLLIQMEVDYFPQQNEGKNEIIQVIKDRAEMGDFETYERIEE